MPFDVPGGVFNSYVLPGKGDGTFGAPVTVAANYINASTVAGDVNGDGKPDLVMMSEGLTDPTQGTFDPSQAGAIVFAGDGAGNLTQGATFAPAFFSSGAALTDLNGDGKPDLLMSEFASVDFTNGFAGGIVGLGNGDGTFTAVGNYEVGDQSTTVLVGNLLNDNAPDGVFVSGGSGTTILIAQGGTAGTVKAEAASIPIGGSAVIDVTLKPTLANRPTPTGTVTLMEGTMLLGQGTLSGGATSITVTGLAAGTHLVTAVYGGDGNFDQNSNGQATVTVETQPAITATSSVSNVTLTKAQTGLIPFTVTANGAFAGDVAISVSGAPTGVNVAVTPASVTLANGGAATASVVVSTNTISGSGATVFPGAGVGGVGFGGNGLPMIAFAFGLVMLMLMAAMRRRDARGLAQMAGIALILLGVIFQAACGGGGSGSGYKGSFTLTITAQPADSTVTPQSATVQVSVN